ncbi:O-antigen ligase family protein [Geothrix sp. 21YS21S-4]|uniref:O-antigen ligase family protein n=1 Tax=Geothrix sp. 21YS21S-4 TaxID=3068889 RepID=UPI0027B9FE1F|nr:O-antigen ligase family protein [Geothrix sp. 21YS21S-4]
MIYYCFIQYCIPTEMELARDSILYVLTLFPVSLFAILGTIQALVRRGTKTSGALTLGFTALVTSVALLRGDIATITACGLIGLTFFTIFSLELSVSPTLLNGLFLTSVLVGITLNILGLAPYGAWPGTEPLGEPVFRAGFTPFIATTGFFSAIIITLNAIKKTAPFRRICLTIGAYFLIFSMVRSALIATGFAILFLILVRRRVIVRTSFQMVYLPLAILCLILLLQADQILFYLSDWGGDTLNRFLFRSTQSIGSSDEAKKSIFRVWLWTEHLRLAGQNPFFGIGTFNLKNVTIMDELLEGATTGSEAWLTGMFARVGAPLALLMADIWSMIHRGLEKPMDLLPMGTGLILLTAMLVYGSFLAPYDFLFLVLAGLLVKDANHRLR